MKNAPIVVTTYDAYQSFSKLLIRTLAQLLLKAFYKHPVSFAYRKSTHILKLGFFSSFKLRPTSSIDRSLLLHLSQEIEHFTFTGQQNQLFLELGFRFQLKLKGFWSP
ncbi:hypothetical protein Lser_V15G02139 [Lactuca serriola]